MLAANGLWEGLSSEEVAEVESSCIDQSYQKDATVYFPGEATNALFMVKKGLVKLSYFDEAGDEAIIRILSPGDVFGEIFLGVKKQLFAATAMTDSEITVISRPTFEKLLARIPQIGVNFISLLSRRLAEAEARIGEFSHSWAYERLERVLLNLSRAHGRETRRGRQIDIHLTHQLLADIIGASRETVSRHLKRLEEQGALKREARRLTVDPEVLSFLLEERAAPKG
jgi:CRP-like cAMP-binding protein